MAQGITLTDGTVELDLGTAYVEPGYEGEDSTAGDATGSVVVSGTVRKNKVGTYTLTYTLADGVAAPSGGDITGGPYVETRTVNVNAISAILDTAFDIGNESRAGADTEGTAYDTLVDAAIAKTATTVELSKSSAFHSEGALDPYEVANSK